MNTQPPPPSLLEDYHVFPSHSREPSPQFHSLRQRTHHPDPRARTPPLTRSRRFYAHSRIRPPHTHHAQPDPYFTALLWQTRSYLLFPDFAILEAASDYATGVLIEVLRGQDL
ncbi:hypothetical protein BV22DRAFT_1041659 [Leucogyrophana mollusca]|uniref:Uncharacterized protein n=1 Tax=Leucogyrophana mollusca TaxID=85980 RepID=A0ACB8B038_9AGAM|nr:hypothetical protein BV22DRAFT_1041659 [Leucogyrophana mollusca]